MFLKYHLCFQPFKTRVVCPAHVFLCLLVESIFNLNTIELVKLWESSKDLSYNKLHPHVLENVHIYFPFMAGLYMTVKKISMIRQRSIEVVIGYGG